MAKDCPHIDSCEMYTLLRLSGTLKIWQTRYCCADYSQCARYQNAARNRAVPANLMPNGAYLRTAPEPEK